MGSSEKGIALQFSKGQVVVHPHHGPATVTKLSTRLIRTERKRYLTLQVHEGDLSVSLPVEHAEEIGVRPVLDGAGVTKIFDVLLAPSSSFDKVWSRRFKDYTERLRSGDIYVLAALVRDITTRNAEKKVSYGEAGLLRQALDLVSAELAIVLAQDETDVAQLIEVSVLEGTRPEPAVLELALAS